MAVEIYMPQLGLTMTEGTVVRWLKAPGDPVRRGEPLFEVETDKVTEEIEAPADGIMGPILVEERVPKPIAFVLGHILAPGEQPPGATPATAAKPEEVAAHTGAAAPQERPVAEQAAESLQGKPVASPRARKMAAKLNLDLAQVEASGPGGRIVEADVRWFADRLPTAAQRPPAVAPATPVAARLAQALGVDLATVQGSGAGGQVVKEDVERAAAARRPEPSPVPAVESRPSLPLLSGDLEPLRGVRRVVAERMAHSFATAPHFYLSAEVEATELLRLRARLLPRVEAAAGVRLTVTDLLIHICAQALREYPAANSAWDESQGGGVRRQPAVNIGMAVALEDGLVVPVVHDADALSLTALAGRRADLVSRAQAGKLSLADLEGGTFTLSNLGMFGVDQFQAILNPPQAAILAVGRVKERPVARDGAVVVRPTMFVTLSVDHRLLDGAQAARFLERVTTLIEEPYLLLA